MRTKIADIADLDAADGKMRVRFDQYDILITRIDGAVHAIDNRCSHAGIPLHKGRVRKCVVTCPSHLAKFDVRDGSIVRGPVEGHPDNVEPQEVFPVDLEDGAIYADLPEKVSSRWT
ncbi:ferredoxin subunit (plasmid) [Rhodococcus jostii RHA1]|uniref:Ferredoxin subunit n=1 Tax=Rhodococcus jostii (strain RHA1) TaxID=101510 RepID=Q0RXX7_RHOJR|nr:Rieske 2Fe-2S domain-containing protein [Rhodococcus jostii]ABG99859.1 ferredoxin subunit [Rhodococcus jostii RHA1]